MVHPANFSSGSWICSCISGLDASGWHFHFGCPYDAVEQEAAIVIRQHRGMDIYAAIDKPATVPSVVPLIRKRSDHILQFSHIAAFGGGEDQIGSFRIEGLRQKFAKYFIAISPGINSTQHGVL